MHMRTFHEAYRNLLSEIMNRGTQEQNARTGVEIKMMEGAHSFKLDLRDGKLPIAGNRRYYPHIAAAETAWQLMGTRDPKFIVSKAPKLWKKFLEEEEDPISSTPREVLKTAYGWRWRDAFGRDQFELALKELFENPTNRQLHVSAWDPRCDGLGGPQPKNVPCPVGFTVSRSNNILHMSVHVRSSDVFVGLPYDVMCYALTLDVMASSVGCSPGTLHFTLHHPHIYQPHWKDTELCLLGGYDSHAAMEVCSKWVSNCCPNLPAYTESEVLKDPESYVKLVRRLMSRVNNNAWDPCPEVVE